MKRTSTLLILGILVVLAVGGYTGYLFWKQSSLEEEQKKVDVNLSEHQNKILQFENQVLLEAISAQRTLSSLQEDLIEWSEVIKDVRRTVPKDNGKDLVQILSYTGSSSNDISMNIKTNSNSSEPYFDVADLIKAFDDSTKFRYGFVPSISAATDEEGREVLTFLFNTTYGEEDPFALLDEEEDNYEAPEVVERTVEEEPVVEEEVVVEEEAPVVEESDAILR